MKKRINPSPKKERQKTKLSLRLTIPVILVVVFQLLTFLVTMAVGGEFRDIRQYAYNTLLEKTENRYNYIRTELQAKPPLVQEYAEQINSLVADVLAQRGETIAQLQTDKDLNYSIFEASLGTVTDLLRRAQANDVFLILETGDLYAEESSGDAKPALYLRAYGSNTSSDYSNLLMEIGYAALSQDYGISRHSGWASYFTPDPGNPEDFAFYYRTMETALENSDLSLNNLGYWCGFSRASSMAVPSMKYTVPLISGDGTVFGVLGIGLSESTILSNIPSHDFLSETACYVLGRRTSEDTFDVLTYSGSAYNTLLGGATTLRVENMPEEDIYSFEQVTDVALTGSIRLIDLYGQNSPYRAERWALISVADKATVLRPLLFLRQMLMISALISLLAAGAIAFFSCIQLIKPISNAIKLMSNKQKYNEIIHFQPSNIYEIDKMTDAITQLQVNSQKFSSQVSRMIRIADVGLGTYMYNPSEDSVFVGQSFQEFQQRQARIEQDTVMSRQEFLRSIFSETIRNAIRESMERAEEDAHEDYSAVYQIDSERGNTQWLRLSTVYAKDQSIGIVQDITEMMLEQKRIEYERDYDRLTGLLNRPSYYRRIEALFHDKAQLKTTAFIMLDLDNLKYVNDTYGHDFGDDYIKTAAKVLKKFQNHGGIVARISGDEFNVCLPGFSTKDEVREIIDHIRTELMQSSCLLADGTHFKVRSSMGVSWYPDDADSYEQLMKYADFAMYTIKHSTKGGIAEFDIESYSADSVLLTGVEEMNRILEEGRVKYAFQSIVSARTGEVFGYEALMRVQSKIFQSPLELMRTAKAGARLYDIELLTWNRSVADFLVQVQAGRIAPDAYIFINSIANIRLNPKDAKNLFENGYPDLRIVAEILESEDAKNDDIAQKYEIMKHGGAKIALDDFGTGYNSEYTMLALQPDIIKIDRSIISGCDKDASRRMIINNLVRLSRARNILVVAEGVETQEELETVIHCGVDLLQGYYLSYPLFEPEPLDPAITETIRRLAAPGSSPESNT